MIRPNTISHTERYSIDAAAADALNRARTEGRRIVAVGTTSVRVLEQAAADLAGEGRDAFRPVEGDASIYILPGHRFRAVDAWSPTSTCPARRC